MLNYVIQDLNHTSGIKAHLRKPPTEELDALLEIVIEGRTFRLALEAKQRAPYPGELSGLFSIRDRIEKWGTPTLVAPVIPETVGNQIVPLGWSWADEDGHYDLRLAPGVRLARRHSIKRGQSKPMRRTLPQGRGGLEIIRLLIAAPHDVMLRTSDLAAAVGVTNARASQVMQKLRKLKLVEKSTEGWIPARDRLLEAFLAEYRGPGGTEILLYSLDDPRAVAAEMVDRVSRSNASSTSLAVSADVGPDLIVPWRRPSKLVVYVDARANIDLANLTEAPDPSAANILVRFPDDRSVFRHQRPVGDLNGAEIPLADESQMIWDLNDLGGEDRHEAARHLSEWLIKNR